MLLRLFVEVAEFFLYLFYGFSLMLCHYLRGHAVTRCLLKRDIFFTCVFASPFQILLPSSSMIPTYVLLECRSKPVYNPIRHLLKVKIRLLPRAYRKTLCSGG